MEDKILTREVDNRVYLGVLKELIEQGKEVPLTIRGNSMAPFLVDTRDTILISPVAKELKRGDMAIFQRINGQYVMHRIRYIHNGKYYFIGDAQTVTEGPIDREQIFGVITAVCRKGKWLSPGAFWWEFFARVWLAVIPARRMIQKCYRFVSKLFARSFEN